MSDSAATAEVVTPRGRGAVATVVFTGDAGLLDERALFRATNDLPVARQELQRILYGAWGREPSEQVVLCRTAADRLEVHCHGGEAAVRRILADLQEAGCATTAWEHQWNSRAGTLAAECEQAVAHAPTLRTAAIALDQQAGALRAAYEQLRMKIWDAPTRGKLQQQLDTLLQRAEFGRHLTQPWSVVLGGQPNVGKSSLINALVGFSRAVVHDRPGTTRDVVTAETALDGWPIRFADTAGIREQAEPIEAAGIESAKSQFAAADCRILVFDRCVPPDDAARALLASWPDAIVVANKCDLPDAWEAALPAAALRTSVIGRQGIDELAAAVVHHLVPAAPPPGTPVPLTQRQVTLLESAQQALADQNHAAYNDAIDRLITGEL